MKFSMNGFRHELSSDVRELRDLVQSIVEDDYWEKEDLISAVNNVITHSNVVNCVSAENDPDFSEMGHVTVDLVGEDDEGEI